MESELILRHGTPDDVPQMLELVRELAIYEHAEHEVKTSVAQMLEDGFGQHPVYGSLVAEADGLIVGIAIYYFRYSTWKGKRLWMEDLIVTQSHRGRGIGKKLFFRVMEESIAQQCTGMMWQVLDWNKPSIEFYEHHQARLDGEWINCHLEQDQIYRLLGVSE